MRIASVLVNVIVPCGECGQDCDRLTRATVTDDGRIGEPLPTDDKHICNDCLVGKGVANAITRKSKTEQRSWANGSPVARVVGEGPHHA